MAKSLREEFSTMLGNEVVKLRGEFGAPQFSASHNSGNARSSGYQDREFCPEWLEVKDFIVDFKAWETSAVDATFAMDFIGKLLSNCHTKVKQSIDLERCEKRARREGLNSKILLFFKPDEPDSIRRKAKKDFASIIENSQDVKINNRTPYCTLQADDAMKPLNRQVGRFLGLIESYGFQKSLFRCKYFGMDELQVMHVDTKYVVANYTFGDGWKLNDSVWSSVLTNISPADAVSKLACDTIRKGRKNARALKHLPLGCWNLGRRCPDSAKEVMAHLTEHFGSRLWLFSEAPKWSDAVVDGWIFYGGDHCFCGASYAYNGDAIRFAL